MKINKNIIKELTEYLNEFNLTEIEYTEKDIKVKVSKSSVSNITTVKEINMFLFILLKSIFTYNNTFKIENK